MLGGLPPVSGFGSPTAGREERACAKAPLRFSEQPGSRSRLGYLLAFKTEPFLGYAGRLPTLLTSSGQKRPEERASITRTTSQSGARAPDRAVQIKESLPPASFCKQHLIVQELSHAAAAPGRPFGRGPAASVGESSDHVLV